MSKGIKQTKEIRNFILKNLSDPGMVTMTSDKFGVSRTAVYQNVQKLVSDNLVTHDNARKNRKYTLVSTDYNYFYQNNGSLSESVIWSQDIKRHAPEQDNVLKIWEYGFTEIFNNAIDHSEGKNIAVRVTKDAINTQMVIVDNGIGIFRKIKEKFNLLNEREAILELSKGKLTTDASKHSGEGIFFTSRAFDRFFIKSHNMIFDHDIAYRSYQDILMEDNNSDLGGTAVIMKLSNDSGRILTDVFDKFAGDDYGFSKTVIPIELARYGDDNLVSRSQAKRVLARLDLFKTVIFDFENVPTIGQAFADEIFRVFANANPGIEINFVNANQDVKNMISRAKVSNITDNA